MSTDASSQINAQLAQYVAMAARKVATPTLSLDELAALEGVKRKALLDGQAFAIYQGPKPIMFHISKAVAKTFSAYVQDAFAKKPDVVQLSVPQNLEPEALKRVFNWMRLCCIFKMPFRLPSADREATKKESNYIMVGTPKLKSIAASTASTITFLDALHDYRVARVLQVHPSFLTSIVGHIRAEIAARPFTSPEIALLLTVVADNDEDGLFNKFAQAFVDRCARNEYSDTIKTTFISSAYSTFSGKVKDVLDKKLALEEEARKEKERQRKVQTMDTRVQPALDIQTQSAGFNYAWTVSDPTGSGMTFTHCIPDEGSGMFPEFLTNPPTASQRSEIQVAYERLPPTNHGSMANRYSPYGMDVARSAPAPSGSFAPATNHVDRFPSAPVTNSERTLDNVFQEFSFTENEASATRDPFYGLDEYEP